MRVTSDKRRNTSKEQRLFQKKSRDFVITKDSRCQTKIVSNLPSLTGAINSLESVPLVVLIAHVTATAQVDVGAHGTLPEEAAYGKRALCTACLLYTSDAADD